MTFSALLLRGFIATSMSLVFHSAQATGMSGKARVIDGDTLAIGNQVIRLYGVDAPENGQTCRRNNGKQYNCGQTSEQALKTLTRGTIHCTGDEFDPYKRLIAVCQSNGVDINRQLIRTGNALAFRRFSQDYVADERYASSIAAGMWSGSFVNPWDFREQKWTDSVTAAPSSDCPIKGNINRKGEKIYHAPWTRSYEKTRIDTTKSERWFCSEAEALAAGWRASYR